MRIFLIVLDSLGIGELPDAEAFGDKNSNTLRSVTAAAKKLGLSFKNLKKFGLYNIRSVRNELNMDIENGEIIGSYGAAAEKSCGKDTTVGHWELAGIISPRALPVYPNGFPEELMKTFSELTGFGWLCNKPYSGTEVIKDYGEEHIKSGKPIVYTSADSVFQIAAHEDIIPVEKLYEICKIARKMLGSENAVGRVIARPFSGAAPDFYRTDSRKDYALPPPNKTILDIISENGMEVIAVGKINDIFAGRGITSAYKTHSNNEGIAMTLKIADEDFNGLCFVNLVDFDMLYGHRNDSLGYAKALAEFDESVPQLLDKLREDDLLLITADHGCDPATPSTDHSREYIPILTYGKRMKSGVDLGVRSSFSDIAATVCELLKLPKQNINGKSFADMIKN